ncbi:hypothetical protein WG66_003368 [Moniliophthora roreri]|nr:hypothetical protein WG66_003368 [Moniliophthora roreri]
MIAPAKALMLQLSAESSHSNTSRSRFRDPTRTSTFHDKLNCCCPSQAYPEGYDGRQNIACCSSFGEGIEACRQVGLGPSRYAVAYDWNPEVNARDVFFPPVC